MVSKPLPIPLLLVCNLLIIKHTLVSATNVKMQKTKTSRTCSTRLIVNSFANNDLNLVHRQKFRIGFFQFKAVVGKRIFLYPVVF